MNVNDKKKGEFNDNSGGKTLEESSLLPDNKPKENDSSLNALVNQEQSLARERLRKEIGREPTQDEVDKWLNEQTESY